MDIVKKNIVSIICGVVALMAAVAVFVWPLDEKYTELKGKVDTRAKVAGKIDGLMRQTRHMPILTVDASEAEKLTQYPNDTIIKAGEDAQKKVAEEAEKIYIKAKALNQANHAVLIPNSLPTPASQTIALNYRRNLQQALDKLRLVDLTAGVPPTPEEIKMRAGVIWENLKGKIVWVNVNGQRQATNEQAVKAEFDAAVAKLPKEMQAEMATKYKMYADPATVLFAPKALPDKNAATPEMIWWAQVEYWVSADVVEAIKSINAESKNVTQSPVKNLIELTVTPAFFPNKGDSSGGGAGGGGVFAARRGGEEAGGGGEASQTPEGGGFPDPSVKFPETGAVLSPTKRVSNNLFDVVHFTMTLDVEADKIAAFLKILRSNRFISVLKMDFTAVDTELMESNRYVYGPNPVVRLSLECEAIFMREWTRLYMPPRIRQALGIPDKKPGLN